MATALVNKHQQNPIKSQSEAIQIGLSAFTESVKIRFQRGFAQFIEGVWELKVFPILKTSQVVLSQNKQLYFQEGLVHQPRILRNVLLTNNEHEVAFAVLSSSQKFTHHKYTSIHHNKLSI